MQQIRPATVNMPQFVHDQLSEAAASNDRSFNGEVIHRLRQTLAKAKPAKTIPRKPISERAGR
jgi:hypothetical protein